LAKGLALEAALAAAVSAGEVLATLGMCRAELRAQTDGQTAETT